MKNYSILYLLFFLLTVAACRKPYTAPAIVKDYNYLVIDGVMNANPGGTTNIKLGRTQALNDTIPPEAELNATVTVEAESGAVYALSAQGNGLYSGTPALNPATRYRLTIRTSNGSLYRSDYVPVKQTPPIDSITWRQQTDQNKDVLIYAHTHDPQNNTRYYRWDYVETWQYRAPLEASIGVNNGMMYFLGIADQQYNCWGTILSSNVPTATSAALSQDVISYAQVNKIVRGAPKLAIRYSINVSQYGLTKEAYQYWQLIEKSTQQTGSIFDPQPAQLIGNIHCISNPDEPVIGYASASYVTEKRAFIDNKELVEWVGPGVPGVICAQLATFQNANDWRIYEYPDTTFAPYYFTTGGGMVVTKKDCLDCRRRGGTSIKPPFWQ